MFHSSSSSSLMTTVLATVACIILATAVIDVVVDVDAAPATLSHTRLDGGDDSTWGNGNSWYVVNDGVMGGRSKGYKQFQSSSTSTREVMKFSGNIVTKGGGFTSVRKNTNMNLSQYAGVVVTVEAEPYTPYDGGSTMTGVQLQLSDSTSSYEFSSAFAIPLSTEQTTTSLYLPMESFDRASRVGYTCSNCSLNKSAIDAMSIYMLFQEGPFDVRIASITAVTEPVSFASPEVKFNTKQDIISVIENAIRAGGSLYDKGYVELCIAMYWSVLNTIVASSDWSANEVIVPSSIKAVICAGLNHMVDSNGNSKTDQAWTLRYVMEAVMDDIMNQPREYQMWWLPTMSSSHDNTVCAARTSAAHGRMIAPFETTSNGPTTMDIPSTAIAAKNEFNTLVAALDATNLVNALSDPNGPYTVFAPTDAAFAALPDGLVTCLLKEKNLPILSNILLYHVTDVGAVKSTALSNNQIIPTLLPNEDVTVRLMNGGVRINDSNVISADVDTSNGIIHVIDSVLVPKSIDVSAFLNTCGGLDNVCIYLGQSVGVGEYLKGPTHTCKCTSSGDWTDCVPNEPLMDIPSTAIAAKNEFNTLVAALDATNLVEALSDPNGPYTVFAPTDAAFAALPDDLVPCLLQEKNLSILSSILLYHVTDVGAVKSTALSNNQIIPTLLPNEDVTVRLMNGGVRINDSKVISADVDTSNGIIHIIDSVLVPKSIDVSAFLNTCLDGPTLPDIPDTASNAGIFKTLIAALQAANLVETLREDGPLTVFAPTDAAFNLLPDDLVPCLLEENNKGVLTSILAYHVASGKVLSTDLSNNQQIPTLQSDDEVVVTIRDGTVKIDESKVTTADVVAGNGVIHIIDAVLVPSSINLGAFLDTCRTKSPTQDIPQTAIASGSFKTLVTALTAADLVEALSEPNGDYTVFAPTDDAFALLPEDLVGCLLKDKYMDVLKQILMYHVALGVVESSQLSDGQKIVTLEGQTVAVDLSDGGVKINESKVTSPDVDTTNGIIHVIDQVLVPPGIDVEAFLNVCTLDDIPTTATKNGSFKTLVAALTAAELVETISEPEGPYTVFAPTDDAFAALPPGLINCLLNDIPTLTKILTYHVASGEVLSTQLTNGMVISTLEGQSVTVDLTNGVKINDSPVSLPDVPTSNGVIHVIDEVLLPPGVNVAAYLDTCTPVPNEKTCTNSKDVIYIIPKTGKKKKCGWIKKGKNLKVRRKRCGKVSSNEMKVRDICKLACGKFAGVGQCKDRLLKKFEQ